MSFVELAWKNVRGQWMRYLMYFLSAALTVTVFAVFACIFFNPDFDSLRVGGSKLSLVLRAAAVAVLLFAVVFVFYSNSFFLRSRKKEIAVYALLGMRQKDIENLLFSENIIIGMAATVAGTALGMLLSRFFSMLLLKLMAVNMNVHITVSFKAALVTLISFAALFSVSSLVSARVIYRTKLIDLLAAEKEGETRPKFSPMLAILSVVLLAGGYIASTIVDVETSGMKLMREGGLVILCIVVGTALFFRSFVPILMRVLQRNKKFYYQPANFISTSQLVYRIRANARVLSIASVLCAVALSMTSSAFSLYRGMEDTVLYYAPYSYLARDLTDAQVDEILSIVEKHDEVSMTACDRFTMLVVQAQCDGYALDRDKREGAAFEAFLLSQSDYNRIIDSTHTQKENGLSNLKTDFPGTVSDGACYLIDGNATDEYCRGMEGKSFHVKLGAADEAFTVEGTALHKYIGMLDLYGTATLVVNDAAYARLASVATAEEKTVYTGLMFDEPLLSGDTVDELDTVVPERFTYIADVPKNASYVGFYRSIFALYGVYVFIGLFVGLLFLLALGSILYYKQLMEAQQDRGRYEILLKTGMRHSEARASVMRQLGMTFGMPLAVGCLHSTFALMTYWRAMMQIGTETPLLANTLLVFAVLLLLYGGFYAVSVRNYLKIVWDKR